MTAATLARPLTVGDPPAAIEIRRALQPSAVMHLDLSEVVSLDQRDVRRIEAEYQHLTRAGWTVRVTPPQSTKPFLVFLHAVVRHEFGWARGSVA
jgi:hypothetical protein